VGPAGFSSGAGRRAPADRSGWSIDRRHWESDMNGIIYLVGLVVVVLAILSFLGLR
jgi:hypothetical protein